MNIKRNFEVQSKRNTKHNEMHRNNGNIREKN